MLKAFLSLELRKNSYIDDLGEEVDFSEHPEDEEVNEWRGHASSEAGHFEQQPVQQSAHHDDVEDMDH